MPDTEAGKRLLAWAKEYHHPGVAKAADAIEAEAYAMGHNDGKVPWPSRDAARAAAIAAERGRIRAAVLAAGMFEGCGGNGCAEERNDELAAVLAIVNPEGGRA